MQTIEARKLDAWAQAINDADASGEDVSDAEVAAFRTAERLAYSIDRPVPFPGTTAEAAANFGSHHWVAFDDEMECTGCCAKPWHAAASYPCGEEPPREIVEVGR